MELSNVTVDRVGVYALHANPDIPHGGNSDEVTKRTTFTGEI